MTQPNKDEDWTFQVGDPKRGGVLRKYFLAPLLSSSNPPWFDARGIAAGLAIGFGIPVGARNALPGDREAFDQIQYSRSFCLHLGEQPNHSDSHVLWILLSRISNSRQVRDDDAGRLSSTYGSCHPVRIFLAIASGLRSPRSRHSASMGCRGSSGGNSFRNSGIRGRIFCPKSALHSKSSKDGNILREVGSRA